MSRKLFTIFAALALMMALPPPLVVAQTGTSTITGIIRDSSGGRHAGGERSDRRRGHGRDRP